ncbi:MFS transporter [Kribbella sandramycini]|uniref:MFS family permease n=1 Tax=Kribbella sandramycini TaxID=60450 RepID=A0A7Y4P238_9ACTN|nr:MFS transporter [Kribbella sandramycini]MBB6566590.1 MFS family permease [Kribbella sandramycini]NOL42755.1 MFS transporter [Kribbella sandramycini]
MATRWVPDLSRSLWRVGGFRDLWLSQTVTLVGTNVTLLALPLVGLFFLDASAFEVGLLWAIEYVPIMLVGLPVGVWVERLPLRMVMIVADVGRAAALLIVPVALWLDFLSMPLLYVVTFVIGLGTLFFDVAQLSILPAIVEEDRLVDANGKLELSRSVAQIGGPGLGGGLIQWLTAPLAILADMVTYLASAYFVMRLPKAPRPEPATEKFSLRSEIVDGMRFVFGHSLIRPLLLCATLAELAFAAVLALQVVFAADELHLTPAVIGIALAVGNGGGVVGALLAEPFARKLGTGTAFMVAIVLFTGGSIILPLSQGAVTFAAGMFVVYLGAYIFNVLQVSLCQAVTPTNLLGRMNSVFRFATWGVIPIGAAGGGLLVDSIGLRNVFWIAAALNVLSFLPPLFSAIPKMRNYIEESA